MTEDVFADRGGFPAWIARATVTAPERESRLYAAVKRLFDLGAALAGLLLLLPVFPFIVLLIKLDTPGPVFFRQVRVGRRGRLFLCY